MKRIPSFLSYVARDILAKHGDENLADIAVVFPNKRASLFLNRELFRISGKPIWSPSYFTISELFRKHSQWTTPDQMELIFRLYNVYREITGSDEPLDHFYSWGQLMLSDFDDLDKNLVDADKLFIDLEAWQSMRDFSFLNEKQRKSLEDFFGNLNAETVLQQRFNDIWKNLGPIYHAYRDSLSEKSIAYEGMLYRDVVEKPLSSFKFKHYIFVGFNLLQKVEQKFFKILKDKSLAEFYWDYDNYFMTSHHEAGRFISQYIKKFPNELSPELASAGIDPSDIYDNISKTKDITYISASTEDVQARYVNQWLNHFNIKDQHSEADASSYAIVLADENLLQNVVNSLPNDIGNVNITTGYPLSASPVATLVYALIELRNNGITDDKKHLKLKNINHVLRHPYSKYISDDCLSVYEEINTHKNYYPSINSLTEGRDKNLRILFDPTEDIVEWLTNVLKLIGIGSRDNENPLMHESVFRMYTLINRLKDLFAIVDIDDKTLKLPLLQRLLTQLINSTTIPFHGEPALGVQVMGVLETRNLDFDHVLLLSCNEGNLPKGVNDASFIPHSLREGFEMTTVENKVAIYSYYFHSLMQRAQDITFTYNNATDDGRQGEMSRFMLQFMVEKNEGQNIKLRFLESGQNVTPIVRKPITKSADIMAKLNSLKSLSPTAISRYLRCNLQFYYATVCGLYEQDDNEDDEIDNAIFGNIFHRTAELIYRYLSGEHHEHSITAEAINHLLKEKKTIEKFLDQAFREKLFKVDNVSFQPLYNGLQLLNRNVIRLYIYRLLKLDMATAPFDILALEENYYDRLTFCVRDATHNIMVGGQIDRLDKVVSGIRVIDYKTGRPLTSTPPSIEEIFDPAFVDSKHTVYYLQSFLYALIIRRSHRAQTTVNKENSSVAPALLFIRQAKGKDYNPILKIKEPASDGKKKASYSLVSDINNVYKSYTDGLKGLLSKIFDDTVPFSPTEYTDRCPTCPYKNICGL